MPSLTASDGTRLHYTETGRAAGRPVVLVAGFKAAATSWRYQLKPLAAAGYRVIAFDRRGHGGAEVGDGPHTMERQGADIHDLLTGLDLREVGLVGQSMGGNAVWAMASVFGLDRVRELVIVDQTPKMANAADWSHGFYDVDEEHIAAAFAAGVPDPGRFPARKKGLVRIIRLMRAMVPRRGGAALTAAELELVGDHAARDWRYTVAAADVPIQFVAGAESEFWPASHAAASAALNPRASSVVIERAGHAANIEQPRRFNDELLAWLRP